MPSYKLSVKKSSLSARFPIGYCKEPFMYKFINTCPQKAPQMLKNFLKPLKEL